VFRLLAPGFVLVAALAPQFALAQVNIDQDKTPAHIYSSDCSVCHKSIHGLANGRGKPALTDFLAEHYTSSRQEAAALAAYVLAGGGGIGTPTPAREEKPQPDRTRPAAEEPKTEPKTREARRPAKPEEEPGAAAKPTGISAERRKPAPGVRSASTEPSATTPEAKPPEAKPPTAARSPRSRQKPAAVAAAPKPAAPPVPQVSAQQASPAPTGSGDVTPQGASPAPTDDIPD